MGRIRTIKPEFWQHEDLSNLPAETHMLAAALLNYADDKGYFNANPKLVKAACSPLREDSMSTQRGLMQLEEIGYIRTGKGEDGKTYGVIVKFATHQNISRPSRSKISELQIEWNDSMRTHGGLNEGSTSEQGTGNREQGTTTAASAANDYPLDFERVWRKYPKREGGNPKPRALKAWKARIKAGADAAEIEAGVERYAAHLKAKGKEGTEFVMQAATFFGPDEHWKQEYTAAPKKKEQVAWGDHMMVDFDAREAARHANG